MTTKHFLRFLAAALSLAPAACVKDNVASGKDEASSYAYIQTRILDQRCIQCHSAGNDHAEESGLILTAGASFANLSGIQPRNENAKQAGYQRVYPGQPEKSLLYKKLLMALDGDSGSKELGHPMPLGKLPLSNGHIEYIRQWILAGAPATSHVAQISLLADTVPGKAPEFQPLEPPLPGQGYQLVEKKFPVAPQFEREFFIYKSVGNPQEIFVNRFKIKMRPGSHHFLLYMYDPANPATQLRLPKLDEFRELRNPDGSLNLQNMTALGEQAFVVGGTQIPEDEFTLPPGVAVKFPADIRLDFNSHYVNYGSSVTYGEVACNLYTVPASDVKHQAMAINMGNKTFKLPAGKTTVITSLFPVKDYIKENGNGQATMNIVSLFSHTHKLGKNFVVVVKGGVHDGDTLYANDNWHHPPYKSFDPPITLGTSDTLASVVTYENTTAAEVGFGFKSTDEMNIVFGYWY